MFSKRLQEINIAEAGIIDDLEIISLAKISNKPINDDMIKAVSIGVFIGLIIGILIIILQELFDTSIGTIEDVGGGLPDRHWIDLGYSDDDWVGWGGWMTIYFLTPVPANIMWILE